MIALSNYQFQELQSHKAAVQTHLDAIDAILIKAKQQESNYVFDSSNMYPKRAMTKKELANMLGISSRNFAYQIKELRPQLREMGVLDREFERGEYSPFLSEMWRTWRASMTSMIGHSTWSYIPNHLYNAKRKQVAEIILHQIETHPTDSLAQGLLIDLIGSGNILRRGAIFGNSSILEQKQMYPEWDNN